jgi:hypothetical protein
VDFRSRFRLLDAVETKDVRAERGLGDWQLDQAEVEELFADDRALAAALRRAVTR